MPTRLSDHSYGPGGPFSLPPASADAHVLGAASLLHGCLPPYRGCLTRHDDSAPLLGHRGSQQPAGRRPT
eukprot:8797338-Alexandrium_andersonii.AAC.1